MPDDGAAAEKEGLSAKFGRWMAVYAAYLFLAGWGYLTEYFAVFGVKRGSVEFGFEDTIAEGFSLLFGRGAWWLSLVYVLILVLAVLIEVVWKKPGRMVDAGVILCLVLFFPLTYLIATRAGTNQAVADRGPRTTLPTIAFTAPPCDYRGKLVLIKGELLYIYDLQYLRKAAGCPFDLPEPATSSVPQLWLVRHADLKDTRVIHYGKGAQP